MRIESSRYTERFGAIMLHDVQKVLELDSGRAKEATPQEALAVQKIDEDTIKDYEEKLAVIIPTKNEKLKLFEGVIAGVPHECLKIIVSNSERKKFDRFRMERDALEQYCRFTQRRALIVHQKDPKLGEAFQAAGYPELLDENGLVRDGKAEGMIVGMLLAKMIGKEYVGFIDADNYFPGSVWEYIRCYAAGFSLAETPYAMVRVLWRYKPKMSVHGMYFKKWGRVSQVTNRVMNTLLSHKMGFDTEIIKTGNAGEHAMSIQLAEILPYASGFAVEPQELLSLFEGFGGALPVADAKAAAQGIEIFQIESRNPHLHEEKGVEHIHEMLLAGLGAIYHSPLCEEETRELIIEELRDQNALPAGTEPPKPAVYPPFEKADIKAFRRTLEPHLDEYMIWPNK